MRNETVVTLTVPNERLANVLAALAGVPHTADGSAYLSHVIGTPDDIPYMTAAEAPTGGLAPIAAGYDPAAPQCNDSVRVSPVFPGFEATPFDDESVWRCGTCGKVLGWDLHCECGAERARTFNGRQHYNVPVETQTRADRVQADTASTLASLWHALSKDMEALSIENDGASFSAMAMALYGIKNALAILDWPEDGNGRPLDVHEDEVRA